MSAPWEPTEAQVGEWWDDVYRWHSHPGMPWSQLSWGGRSFYHAVARLAAKHGYESAGAAGMTPPDPKAIDGTWPVAHLEPNQRRLDAGELWACYATLREDGGLCLVYNSIRGRSENRPGKIWQTAWEMTPAAVARLRELLAAEPAPESGKADSGAQEREYGGTALEERCAKQERERIVAWLRDIGAGRSSVFARRIEEGQHLKPDPAHARAEAERRIVERMAKAAWPVLGTTAPWDGGNPRHQAMKDGQLAEARACWGALSQAARNAAIEAELAEEGE